MPAARKGVKKKPVRKAVKKVKKNSTPKEQAVCYVCGREIVVNEWGDSERLIFCCGKVMECKK